MQLIATANALQVVAPIVLIALAAALFIGLQRREASDDDWEITDIHRYGRPNYSHKPLPEPEYDTAFEGEADFPTGRTG